MKERPFLVLLFISWHCSLLLSILVHFWSKWNKYLTFQAFSSFFKFSFVCFVLFKEILKKLPSAALHYALFPKGKLLAFLRRMNTVVQVTVYFAVWTPTESVRKAKVLITSQPFFFFFVMCDVEAASTQYKNSYFIPIKKEGKMHCGFLLYHASSKRYLCSIHLCKCKIPLSFS